MNKKYNLNLVLLVLFIGFINNYAQHNSTTYYMQDLPQSNILNPAFQPGCNFYISLPSLSMNIQNSTLNFNNIFKYSSDSNRYYTPFHAMATQNEKDDFLNNFKDVNTILTDFNVNLFSIGFRSDDIFFSFQIAQRLRTNIDYPRDLMRILINGNGEAGLYDWSGLGLKINAFQEFALAFSKKVDNTLTYGIRGKILFGQIDFNTSKQNITLDIDTFDILVNSSFEINGRVPLLDIYTSNGVFDSLNIQDFELSELTNLLLEKSNLGFGFDFGVIYNASNRLALSASVLDLGIITWRKNIFNLQNDSEFDFTGIDIDITGNDESEESDTSGFFGLLIDSLKNSFTINSSNDPYTSFLTAKVLFGLNYKLHDKVDLGLLTHTEIYRMKFFPRVTLSANLRPFRWLNTSFSYSVLNMEYYNLGFGFSFKPGPFNIYFIGDTYPLVLTKGTPIPVYSKGFRFQVGFNLVFGVKKLEKAEGDTPLLE